MARSPSTQTNRDAARGNIRMRLEQWARNPTCEANTISAVRNVRMAAVARAAGEEVAFGQSPFAIARGNQFERDLFRDDASRLLPEIIKHGILPDGASGFLDLRQRRNGGTRVESLDEAIDQTRALVARLGKAARPRHPDFPTIVAGASIRVPKGILLPEAILIIDALAIRLDGGRPELIVGEIKTYPDRGGYTDPAELAVARAQAGIYVHGLDLVVGELGLGKRLEVSRHGFLVLSRPGSNRASIRPREELHYQAERARRGFDLLERAAAALDSDLWAADDTNVGDVLARAILSAETTYNQACLSFCDLASRCYRRACQEGDPAILGEDVRRFLGNLNLARAVALLGGAAPLDEAERDLVKRIESARGMIAP